MNAIVLIGGGRITTALIAGLRRAGYNKPIVVHDRNPQKLRALNKNFRIIAEPNLNRAVARAELLIISVRPDAVHKILRDVQADTKLAASGSRTKRRKHPLIAISLAAGIPLAHLRSELGPPVRWVRAMPSPVSSSGNGLTALAFARDLAQSQRGQVRDLFANVGAVVDIPEAQFDTFTVTYSSTHGYHALAALAESAIKLGLDRNSAFLAAAHALADGINYWRAGNIPLDRLLDEAATPGGVAATTMSAMDKAGHRRAVEKGLQAGLQRTRANAQ
jgi:pyrroline-5-carboxylate reductase